MFKYKSPLSRLLEGAGKSKEEEHNEAETAQTEQQEQSEPIADFNALRQALAGGKTASDDYEDADELIPEASMPEFKDTHDVEQQEAETDENDEVNILAQVVDAENDAEDDQVVTLHLTPSETSDEEVLSGITQATTAEFEDVVEVAVEARIGEEPTPEPIAEKSSEHDIEAALPEPEAEPTPAPADDRRSRVKTTFLGFERADTHAQDLIDTAKPVAKAETAQQTFPVGWLVVTAGPGRGSCITLTEGLMQIGRNDDQAIQLDFGDTGISRSSHAVIAYDPEDRKCYLGHGGKANLVRLNGKPVLSTIALENGDLIRISETSIRFTAFCDERFDWRDAD